MISVEFARDAECADPRQTQPALVIDVDNPAPADQFLGARSRLIMAIHNAANGHTRPHVV